jgi:hypothetical protein
MVGYSGTPLIKKLGIKSGLRLIFINAPGNYDKTLGGLPNDVEVKAKLENPMDFIQFFTRARAELETQFPILMAALSHSGMLWISWPKKASKIPTDLNEDIIREIGLENGLVDVKVCAVDEVWSGLKFVYRVKDR